MKVVYNGVLKLACLFFVCYNQACVEALMEKNISRFNTPGPGH